MQMIMKDVKIMKFDEAETKVESLVGDLNIPLGIEGALLDVIDKLREEYAPTVEMTKEQRDLILRNQDEDRLYEIMGTEDGYYFDSTYWGDIEPHEVAQAYLHPKIIKVVDE